MVFQLQRTSRFLLTADHLQFIWTKARLSPEINIHIELSIKMQLFATISLAIAMIGFAAAAPTGQSSIEACILLAV